MKASKRMRAKYQALFEQHVPAYLKLDTKLEKNEAGDYLNETIQKLWMGFVLFQQVTEAKNTHFIVGKMSAEGPPTFSNNLRMHPTHSEAFEEADWLCEELEGERFGVYEFVGMRPGVKEYATKGEYKNAIKDKIKQVRIRSDSGGELIQNLNYEQYRIAKSAGKVLNPDLGKSTFLDLPDGDPGNVPPKEGADSPDVDPQG